MMPDTEGGHGERRLGDDASESRAACTSAAPDGKINRIILPNCSFVSSVSPSLSLSLSLCLPFFFLFSGTPLPRYYDSKVGVTRKVARAKGAGSLERNGKYSSLTSYPRRTTATAFRDKTEFYALKQSG